MTKLLRCDKLLKNILGDSMRKHIKELTLVGIFPALMAATAGFYIPLGTLPNITFQTFFVFLAGLLLGSKKGSLSIIIYILLGAIGLPVFSGFQGGIGVLFGYSGGFILSFVPATFFVGILKEKLPKENLNFIGLITILLVGNIIIYLGGSIYLSILTKTTFYLIITSFFIYIPGDLVKIVGSILIYQRLKKINIGW